MGNGDGARSRGTEKGVNRRGIWGGKGEKKGEGRGDSRRDGTCVGSCRIDRASSRYVVLTRQKTDHRTIRAQSTWTFRKKKVADKEMPGCERERRKRGKRVARRHIMRKLGALACLCTASNTFFCCVEAFLLTFLTLPGSVPTPSPGTKTRCTTMVRPIICQLEWCLFFSTFYLIDSHISCPSPARHFAFVDVYSLFGVTVGLAFVVPVCERARERPWRRWRWCWGAGCGQSSPLFILSGRCMEGTHRTWETGHGKTRQEDSKTTTHGDSPIFRGARRWSWGRGK